MIRRRLRLKRRAEARGAIPTAPRLSIFET